MTRYNFAAYSINPPKFKQNDMCFVFGPTLLAAAKHQNLHKYNNHGRIVGFDALFNEYAVVLLGMEAHKPVLTKFKASEIDLRLNMDENEFYNLKLLLERAEHFPARDQVS